MSGFSVEEKTSTSSNAGKLTEKEIKERESDNLRRSLSRTVQTLRRRINANIGRWGIDTAKFMTLTFKQNITEHEIGNKEFTKFIRRLNKHVFKKESGLKYVCVVERQKRGALHYHVIFFNLPYVPFQELLGVWENGEQRGLRINKIDTIENVGSYVVKYISKDINSLIYSESTTEKTAKEINKKLYFCSRGLHKPVEFSLDDKGLEDFVNKYTNEEYDMFENEYENEHRGKTKYRQIKKKIK